MARKRSLFVLGIMALFVSACAQGATPTPVPAATPTSAPGATPTVAPQIATPKARPTSAPAPVAAPAKPRNLRMMMSSEPVPENLFDKADLIHQGEPYLSNTQESLVDIDREGNPVPKLATRWEQRDPTTWRFYLREGVKFHNGDNLTARDVVELAKWNRQEKKTSLLYRSVPIEEAVAVDDYTVDLIFAQVQPLLLLNIAAFHLPPIAITRRDYRENVTREGPNGTGPYRFKEWRKGQRIKLTRFEGYWGPQPQIDNVEIMFRADAGVRLAALRVGEVDWVQDVIPELASRAPKVVRMPSPNTVYVSFDEYIQAEFGGQSILADKRLRLAVDYAIDRQSLVGLYAGLGTPSLGQFASPGDFGFNPDLKSRPYDLKRAEALVREAGAVGKTVTLAASNDKFMKDREVGEAIASMIEQAGLKVKLMLMPYAEQRNYRQTYGDKRQYQTDIVLVFADALLEVEKRFAVLLADGGTQLAHNDPEATRLYKEVLSEADYAKRGNKLAKAWAYAYEEAHYVPLYKLDYIWGLAKNLEWKPDIVGRATIANMRFTD